MHEYMITPFGYRHQDKSFICYDASVITRWPCSNQPTNQPPNHTQTHKYPPSPSSPNQPTRLPQDCTTRSIAKTKSTTIMSRGVACAIALSSPWCSHERRGHCTRCRRSEPNICCHQLMVGATEVSTNTKIMEGTSP